MEDKTEENLYDLYLVKCENNHWTPSISDYVIWRDENYPEEDMTQEPMTEERMEEIGRDSERDYELDLIEAIGDSDGEYDND